MRPSTGAAQAGLVTSKNEESHIVRGDAALRDNVNQEANPTQSGTTAQLDHAKRLATLTAQCALAGVLLYETTDDHDRPAYVVTRWALTRQLATLDEVQQWLVQVMGVSC
ncbi:hypothetical protein [Rhodoferax sp. GW822-FHT02A01]|uniref:hypothetical protein n=1 Tax=Rhodoferax sp. GW822-FHT02A01 TaxID=3141537 RepID=UPI00315CEEA9